MPLSGKVAVVLGGGGGFGREISLTLARSGAMVVVADNAADKAGQTAQEIRSLGQNAAFVPCDVTDPKGLAAVMEKIAATYGDLHVFVNSSGVTLGKPAVDIDEQDWARVIDVNLRGSFFAAQAAGRQMIQRGGGAIVNIASTSAVLAEINTCVYAVSKAGVVALTRNLAREWARYNIRVNAVAPGYAHTPLTESLMHDDKTREAFLRRIPLRRLCTPRDVARAVLFLVLDDASFITGHVLMVDGGQST